MSAPHRPTDTADGAHGVGRNCQSWANETEVDRAIGSPAPVPEPAMWDVKKGFGLVTGSSGVMSAPRARASQ
jgi:hypothetical protein